MASNGGAVAERPHGLAPTEATPDLGRITAFGVVVSEAQHWVEDGIHVLRSTEFDLVAGDADFQRAVDLFGEKTQDLFWYLADLPHITEVENDTFVLLAPRFMQIQQELERREAQRRRQLVSFPRLKRRGAHDRNWQPLSTPRKFSQPSHA